MLFIFLMCMLTDRQMLVICFWRVILLSNMTPSIITYSLNSILSLHTTRHWLSHRLFFVLKSTNSVLSSLNFNALRRHPITNVKKYGFLVMPGKGSTDAIFIMRQVQEMHQARKKMHLTDSREVVRWALRKLGVDVDPHSYGIVYRGLYCSYNRCWTK